MSSVVGAEKRCASFWFVIWIFRLLYGRNRTWSGWFRNFGSNGPSYDYLRDIEEVTAKDSKAALRFYL
ncbi:MAG: hypothetical protein QF886_26435, partial [Planctomycetota bacterium]|nr:hypothetical protein [Planctomycetota bacterium]